MRSSLLAELSSDYVRFAKARGLSANRILVCHILRNALPPVVTIFFQQFGFLIAGGAVIESVFSIKGIGTYLVDSVVAADTIAVSTCKEIAMQALKTACTFYGGDWAGTLEVDLDFDV